MEHNNLSTEKYISLIKSQLQTALVMAQQMQAEVITTEGDTDLNRKLDNYLIPNLIHWISGPQGGNIKDLELLFEQRKKK